MILTENFSAWRRMTLIKLWVVSNGQYSKIIRRKSTLVNLMMRNLNILAPGAGLNFDHGRVFL